MKGVFALPAYSQDDMVVSTIACGSTGFCLNTMGIVFLGYRR
jgi:hypothetical protein